MKYKDQVANMTASYVLNIINKDFPQEKKGLDPLEIVGIATSGTVVFALMSYGIFKLIKRKNMRNPEKDGSYTELD